MARGQRKTANDLVAVVVEIDASSSSTCLNRGLRGGKEMDDYTKVTVWVPDQESLNKLLSAASFSLECGAPQRDASGLFVVTLYASKAEAAKVAALGMRYEIDEQYGAILKERQKEVSRTDRFKGGKVKPKGLGEKR